MKSLVKINIKLTGLISAFVLILFLGNIIFLDNSLNKNIEYTCKEHYKATVNNLENVLEGLFLTTGNISKNDDIIEVLENNESFSDFSKEEIDSMKSLINLFEGLLKSLSFVNTINISSIKGNYLFSKGIVYGDFKVKDRPWFNEKIIDDNQSEAIISSIHQDFNTGKNTLSIISPITSGADNALLGFVILDIFVEDLLNYINNTYYIGDINSYIRINGEEFYGVNGIEKPLMSSTDNTYIVIEELLEDRLGALELELEYDINSITYNKSFEKFKNFQFLFYSIFGIILSIILIIIVKVIFKPIIRALDRFRPLIESKDSIDKVDELKELENIAESLVISFNKKINNLIYFDELTKLPNRKQLQQITSKLIKSNKKFALIFIDLDKFKQTNDILGHLVGDALLKRFGEMLKEAIGEYGVVTRYSGDEFIIIFTDYTTEENLKKFYNEKILSQFIDPIRISNNNIKVEFSSGVSIFPKDGESLDVLIRNSDFIMYMNKHNKKNNEILFFNDEIYINILKIEEVKHELRNAVANNELLLFYQPIVDKDNVPKKIEALIRWKNKKLGFVPPGDFIEYAEETGDIIDIGFWIIEEVCKNYKALQGNLSHNLMVNINVSPIQLMRDDFTKKTCEIVDRYNIPHDRICFEITESVFIDENNTANFNLKELSLSNFKIALDDFGTGYSSFSYLKKFKLDTLKLDKMFIKEAVDLDYKIIDNLIKIATHLNMDVVVEGVEEEKQFKRLKAIHCDLFQGYIISKPLSLDGIMEFLHKNK